MNIIRTVTNARYLNDGQEINIEMVSSWSISNFTDSVLRLIINNTVTPIPAIDTVTGEPGQFNRDGDISLSDIVARVEFANPSKTGEAIIYFNALKKDC